MRNSIFDFIYDPQDLCTFNPGPPVSLVGKTVNQPQPLRLPNKVYVYGEDPEARRVNINTEE